MASLPDHGFEHRNLVRKILLLAEKVDSQRANWGTFCTKLFDIKLSFF
jgi:hypothetical protein